jgi:hypothetical protein
LTHLATSCADGVGAVEMQHEKLTKGIDGLFIEITKKPFKPRYDDTALPGCGACFEPRTAPAD